MATLTSLPGELIDIIIDHIVIFLPKADRTALNYLEEEPGSIEYDYEKLKHFASNPPPTIPHNNVRGLSFANHFFKARTEAALKRFEAAWDSNNVIYILADEKNRHLGINWLIRNPQSDNIHYNIHTSTLSYSENNGRPKSGILPALENFINAWVVGTRSACDDDEDDDCPWSSVWEKMILDFTYEHGDDKYGGHKIGHGAMGNFDKSETWRDTCQEMLDRERGWEWGPRYDGCPSWMNGMADSWKIRNLEIKHEGKFVFSCDMFATLEAWDDEFYTWKSHHIGAWNVGDWAPVGNLIYVESDQEPV